MSQGQCLLRSVLAGDIEYFAILIADNACAIAQWHRMKENVAKMGPGFVERVDAALVLPGKMES